MGEIMKEDDVFIGGLLDELNIRFGPSQGRPDTDWFGGIDEMVQLQKEFELFRANRTFRDSVAVLNIGGVWNARVRNRWLRLLQWLTRVGSNIAGKTGDQAIAEALIANLAATPPMPVYFTAHYSADSDEDQVRITRGATPLIYMAQRFLTVSIPMRPRTSRKRPPSAPRKGG
jgi:hypothetical protein